MTDNRILLASIVGWMAAQGLKVLLGIITERRFNFRWLVGSGGMPSSHSSGVSALATSVGLIEGFGSPLFAVTLVFALVTMFDAQGVRRATGQQAEALNKMLEDIYWKRPIAETRLIELIGHTPIEVFVGSAIGVFLAIVCVTA